MRNSKAVGDRTESKALAKLIECGYSVAVPFGDNEKYDLVVDSGDTFYRVQCKTAWSNKEGTIRFNTHSQTTKDGVYHEQTYQDAVDAFLVYYPENGQFYWIETTDAPEQKMELRFESEIDHPAINWAETYEFDEAIP
ncbi:group I intron-associated PD-(D/E)XK endonuclease [Natronolimnohabitans sp. A-GB9]|uniref:group I intron-associated PD-(D/E)XK endonuclease n=1 Tax=Natronolimnohabitans sp. A-GB9 TaxID=3069757 RepID=UPI0027B5FC4D|nr:group I intron-associated PD-(D/E)XK endonuclease [Natronolimnohabitans sp. A-GB9]MDQ2050953.1 group I intron-associated PD-(D/E)XK endonuclease [Natronolimnohabitans sp. A-GB9]